MLDEDMDGGRLVDDEAEDALNVLCSSLSQRGANKVRELLASLPTGDDSACGDDDDDSQRIAAERLYKATQAHHRAKEKARALEERRSTLTQQLADVEVELEQQHLAIDRLARLVEDSKFDGQQTSGGGAPTARAAAAATAHPPEQAHGTRAAAVAPGAVPGAAVAAFAASSGAAAKGAPASSGSRPRRPTSAGKHAQRPAAVGGVRRGALKPNPAQNPIEYDEPLSDDPSDPP